MVALGVALDSCSGWYSSRWSKWRFGCFWIFSWLPIDYLCWAYGYLQGVRAHYSSWIIYTWDRIRFSHGGILDSFSGPYLLGLCLFVMSGVCFDILFSYFVILIRHVLWDSTSAADFLANWACTHRVSWCFLCTWDLPTGLYDILHLGAQTFPHIRR